MASRQTVDHIISHEISFPSLPNLPFFMHVKICTPICHFNWLKSSNGEQNAGHLLALLALAQSVSAFSATQNNFWPLFLSIFSFLFFSFLQFTTWSSRPCFLLACNVTAAVWHSIQWRCAELSQKDHATQLIWLLLMYITHPRVQI